MWKYVMGLLKAYVFRNVGPASGVSQGFEGNNRKPERQKKHKNNPFFPLTQIVLVSLWIVL